MDFLTLMLMSLLTALVITTPGIQKVDESEMIKLCCSLSIDENEFETCGPVGSFYEDCDNG